MPKSITKKFRTHIAKDKSTSRKGAWRKKVQVHISLSEKTAILRNHLMGPIVNLMMG